MKGKTWTLKVVRDTFHVLAQMDGFVAPIRPLYVLGVALGSLDGFSFTFIVASTFQTLLDSLQGSGMSGLASSAARAATLVLAGALVFGLASSYLAAYIKHRVGAAIRDRLHAHMLWLTKTSFERLPPGDLLSGVSGDADAARDFVSRGLSYGVLSPLMQVLGSIALLSLISPWLTLMSLVIGGLSFGIQSRKLPGLERIARDYQETRARAMGIALTVLEGLPLIRMIGIQDSVIGRYDRNSEHLRSLGQRQIEISIGQSVVGKVCGWLNDGAIVGAGLLLLSTSSISIGAFFASMRYAVVISQMFHSISQSLASFQKGAAGARRIMRILSMPMEEAPREEPIHELRCHPVEEPVLRIKDLCFTHAYTGRGVHNISFDVHKGEVITFVGPSAAGKSTLLHLVLGLYRPDLGEIRILGRQMDKESVHALRSHVAFVPQVVHLFYGTVRENILYGKEGASEAETVLAARLAGAHEFISDLPEGYGANVGENGCLLSVGQRQRIGIARALIQRAPLLLMDEPTSSLDAQAEGSLIESILRIDPRPATIIVTHRLAAARCADSVQFLKDGAVTEHGSHEALLALGGEYASYYELQTGSTRT